MSDVTHEYKNPEGILLININAYCFNYSFIKVEENSVCQFGSILFRYS